MQPIKHFGKIFNRELKAYFISPIAYIVIIAFLVFTGIMFFQTFFLNGQADMRNFFSLLPWVFAFVIPALAMRLFSEEVNIGSYEILLTLPVTFLDIILGKFLAVAAFVAIMLVPTFSYPITVTFLGRLDWGTVVGGYAGAVFLGAAFSAIGLFASSLTRNQIISLIIGIGICIFLVLVDKFLFLFPPLITGFFQYLGADYHFRNIARGVFDTRDLIYFASIGFVSLYGTYLVMVEKK